MGFNKMLLDHFSETLRCNQYPKRYPGDKAKIYDIFAKSNIFCLLCQLGTWYWISENIRKESIFNLLDFNDVLYGSLVTSYLMEGK